MDDMSLLLRTVLIVVSVLTTLYIMRKIRNSKAKVEDSMFWIVLSVGLIIFSVFPGIPIALKRLLGIEATVNFLFLCMIFVLMAKIFSMSLKLSYMETKVKDLTQEIAIRNKKTEKTTNDMKEEEKDEIIKSLYETEDCR